MVSERKRRETEKRVRERRESISNEEDGTREQDEAAGEIPLVFPAASFAYRNRGAASSKHGLVSVLRKAKAPVVSSSSNNTLNRGERRE